MSQPSPRKLFISYSRADSEHLTALETHLATLKRQKLVEAWTDRALDPGASWSPELLEALRTADIVLLLVSPAFMASDYIQDVELKETFDRHARGEVRVIPILVRPTDLKGDRLDTLQGLPRDRKAIVLWRDRDEAWLDVVNGIRRVLPTLNAPMPKPVAVAGQSTSRASAATPVVATPPPPALEPSMTSPTLTLLHLSDLHFGQDASEASSRFKQDRITRGIKEDAAELAKRLGPPDAILVTGDVAFSAQPAQYEKARDWLYELAAAVGAGSERILVVPGNHDVDRGLVTGNFISKLTHDGLRAAPVNLDHLLNPGNAAQLQTNLWPKLTAYADFSRGFGAPAISPTSPWWRYTLSTPIGPVQVVGLNTCLLSFDGTDAPTNLALGQGQLEGLFKDVPSDSPVIVLGHHPPEWLTDGKLLWQYLQKYPHLLLTGHVHDQGGLLSHSLDSRAHLHFVAGAGHLSRKEQGQHAYAWLTLSSDGLGFYPRFWNEKRGAFQPEGNAFGKLDGQERLLIRTAKLPDLLEGVLKSLAEAPPPPQLTVPPAEPLIPPAWRERLQKLCGLLETSVDANQRRALRTLDVYVPLEMD